MDREKVIKQLENDAIATDTGYVEVPLWLFSEILFMLKEQEPIEPVKDGNGCLLCGNQGIDCGVVGLYDIETGKTTERYCNYCPDCGKRVKWDA